MSVWVAHGSVIPNSSKIFLNFGMMDTMMNTRMHTATKTTTAGYTIAPMILDLRLWAFSRKSASRCRITSSAPPASPARTMFTYSLLNALGCLPSASDSAEPDSTSSTTSIIAFFSALGFIWRSRMRRLRSTGRPASWRVENCRVKVTSIFCLTPPMTNVLRLRPVFLAFLPFGPLPPAIAVSLVTK